MEEQVNIQANEELEAAPLAEEVLTEAEASAAAEQPTETLDDLSRALMQAEEFKAALQRERADFQNFRKRMERETEAFKGKITADVLEKFLPVMDDFNRALETIPPEEQATGWVAGIASIQRKLQNLLEAEGIVPFDPLGDPFDPSFHEAIGADEPSEQFASGHVTAVLQKGYKQGERVLRPAIVRVAN